MHEIFIMKVNSMWLGRALVRRRLWGMLTITHSQAARELDVKHAAFAAESAGS
jgi:hypothetical protein